MGEIVGLGHQEKEYLCLKHELRPRKICVEGPFGKANRDLPREHFGLHSTYIRRDINVKSERRTDQYLLLARRC